MTPRHAWTGSARRSSRTGCSSSTRCPSGSPPTVLALKQFEMKTILRQGFALARRYVDRLVNLGRQLKQNV